MDFFCFKLSNEKAVGFAEAVLSKSQNITISQLNQLADILDTGKFVFINFGGDRATWEKGLVGLAEIVQGPFDHGYDTKNVRNFRIRIKMQLVLNRPIKREEFIPYRDTYDAAGIGPSTRGEQNQAIKRVDEQQAAVLIRAMLDSQPDIESTVNQIFPSEFISKIKGKVTMLLPQQIAYGEGKKKEYSETSLVGDNILLFGVPGSGKSHTIKTEYCDDDNFIERIVFHPEYSYTDFVGQILPKVSGEKLQYIFTPGPFTRIIKKAYEDHENMYYLVIEEINRGNAPAIFGDIFQLLDRDDNGKSEYGITNADISNGIYNVDNIKIKIPGNLSILATMNTSDQNVFTLDTAFKRRWVMRMIENDIEHSELGNKPIWETGITWGDFATKINDMIIKHNSNGVTNADKRLGAYFIKAKDLSKGNRVFPEKVLMYLWDDVFKFERDEIFNTEKYPTLEAVVEGFMKNSFEVFTIDFGKDSDVIK
jgi:hypothetical protein